MMPALSRKLLFISFQRRDAKTQRFFQLFFRAFSLRLCVLGSATGTSLYRSCAWRQIIIINQTFLNGVNGLPDAQGYHAPSAPKNQFPGAPDKMTARPQRGNGAIQAFATAATCCPPCADAPALSPG